MSGIPASGDYLRIECACAPPRQGTLPGPAAESGRSLCTRHRRIRDGDRAPGGRLREGPGPAAEYTQEIPCAVWRSFATFRNQCSLRTWVYRVAHNAASSFTRRHYKFRRAHLVSLEQLDERPWIEQSRGPEESPVERLHDEAAVTERLRELIRQLKPIDRDVILLYLEGIDAASIGDVLGLSPDNVAQKVHRTKKVLQRRFRIERDAGLQVRPTAGDRDDVTNSFGRSGRGDRSGIG